MQVPVFKFGSEHQLELFHDRPKFISSVGQACSYPQPAGLPAASYVEFVLFISDYLSGVLLN